MNLQKPVPLSLLHALAVIAYIVIVVFIINSMGPVFEDQSDDFWTPVLFLMLFVVSAAITGTLVLGRPAYLYFNDQKKESIQFLVYTICWLFVFMLTAFAIYIIAA